MITSAPTPGLRPGLRRSAPERPCSPMTARTWLRRLQTIREIGDATALEKAIDLAFPGSELEIAVQSGRFEIMLRQHGLLRPLGTAELSDGTLRYLLWVAALLTPRPPALLVLNEPETSLHPDLLPPLADLIVTAAGAQSGCHRHPFPPAGHGSSAADHRPDSCRTRQGIWSNAGARPRPTRRAAVAMA